MNYSTITNITDWRLNGKSIAILNMPFEGGSNSTFTRDYSTYGNNGTVVNAAWNSTGGYDGHGDYLFNGLNSYISISSSQINTLGRAGSNYTVSAWVFKKTNADMSVVEKWIGTPYPFVMRNIICAVYNGSLNPATNTISVTTNSWHLITCVFDSNISIYVDGVISDSKNNTLHDINTNNTGAFPIGRRRVGTSGFGWNGSIDQVMIYNRSLSSQQIFALYNNRTDLIVSQETQVGENWSVAVTPNNGTRDVETLTSNNLTII